MMRRIISHDEITRALEGNSDFSGSNSHSSHSSTRSLSDGTPSPTQTGVPSKSSSTWGLKVEGAREVPGGMFESGSGGGMPFFHSPLPQRNQADYYPAKPPPSCESVPGPHSSLLPTDARAAAAVASQQKGIEDFLLAAKQSGDGSDNKNSGGVEEADGSTKNQAGSRLPSAASCDAIAALAGMTQQRVPSIASSDAIAVLANMQLSSSSSSSSSSSPPPTPPPPPPPHESSGQLTFSGVTTQSYQPPMASSSLGASVPPTTAPSQVPFMSSQRPPYHLGGGEGHSFAPSMMTAMTSTSLIARRAPPLSSSPSSPSVSLSSARTSYGRRGSSVVSSGAASSGGGRSCGSDGFEDDLDEDDCDEFEDGLEPNGGSSRGAASAGGGGLKRRRLTAEERAQRSRERNRMHAKKTRQRKKLQMDAMSNRIESLKNEFEALRSRFEERYTALILVQCGGGPVDAGAAGGGPAASPVSDAGLQYGSAHEALTAILGRDPDAEVDDLAGRPGLSLTLPPLDSVHIDSMLAGAGAGEGEDGEDGGSLKRSRRRGKYTALERETIRRERNRMHAKRTRDRKKLFVEEAEATIARVEAECLVLRRFMTAHGMGGDADDVPVSVPLVPAHTIPGSPTASPSACSGGSGGANFSSCSRGGALSGVGSTAPPPPPLPTSRTGSSVTSLHMSSVPPSVSIQPNGTGLSQHIQQHQHQYDFSQQLHHQQQQQQLLQQQQPQRAGKSAGDTLHNQHAQHMAALMMMMGAQHGHAEGERRMMMMNPSADAASGVLMMGPHDGDIEEAADNQVGFNIAAM